jgi:hypothetical protein
MLSVEPEELSMQQWKLFGHHWQSYNESSASTEAHCFHRNEVFANRNNDDKKYPPTTGEIAEAQWVVAILKHLFKCNAVIDQGLNIKPIAENTTCVWKDGRLVISKPFQVRAVKRYHNYLQYPGHTCLKKTMNAAMYWKGMHTTIQSITKSCRSGQSNKRQKLKYGQIPPKTVISNPGECLYVKLIGPYTLKDKDNLQIDIMALTMINPASS